MKATELRIGNLVNYITAEGDVLTSTIDWQDLKWLSEDEKGFNLVHNLIPLTEDFLLKFGFEKTYNSQFRLKFDHIKHQEIGFDFSKVEDKSMQGFRFYGHYIKIHHVHQLQNLFFALTGEELTLKNQSK
jgi:hypothetical protein